MVCTICKFIPGNEEYIFTHTAFECPFMKTNICTNCFQYGHTPKYCKQQKVFVSRPVLADVERYRSGEDAEDEMLKRVIQYEKVCEKLAILNGNYTGACTFCRNSKQYNPCNRWMNNHTLTKCPRLALVVCRFCGCKGHTDRKCQKKQQQETACDSDEMMGGVDGENDQDAEMIVDFDIYDEIDREGEMDCVEQKGSGCMGNVGNVVDEIGFNMMSMKI